MNGPQQTASGEAQPYRAGFVAVVGRPNVGKSTLTNALVGAKVSIVSKKQQTTRHRVHGIVTTDEGQIVLVDTPGFQTRHKRLLNHAMNRVVTQALADVDLVLFVIEAGKWTADDQRVLRLLPATTPVFLVINKVDRLPRKELLLPFIAERSRDFPYAEIVPISAEKNRNLDDLVRTILRYLPESEPIFPLDAITDRSERFLAAEYLREKLFRFLGDELPYGIAVEIRRFEEEGRLRRIWAEIIVEREAHKPIVIGEGGERIKRIASEARKELEELLDASVYLDVWVKVRGGWADDPRALRELGLDG
ncbi:GTPase Era [Hydrogenophilus islandicus]